MTRPRRACGSSTADGQLAAEVLCAAAEVGQGVIDVIAQVARTELGTDDVIVTIASTAEVGSAGSSPRRE